MTTQTKTREFLRVTISPDTCVDNPCDWDCQWRHVSFNRRHYNYADPETVGFEWTAKGLAPSIGLRAKLRAGTAFILSYYEHGLCRWDVSGTARYADAQWDSVSFAGVLLWEHPVDHLGAKDYQGRLKDAQGFLETYTDWCNGNVWGYQIESYIEDEDGEHWESDVDSCWGYFGSDSEYMKSEIMASIKAAGYDTERIDIDWDGDGAYLCE